MPWQKPEPAVIWRAITLYLVNAYDGAPDAHAIPAKTPSAVRARLDSLHHAPADDFYASPVFERETPTNPARLCLRLGNRHYPHMKLAVDRSPDGRGHLLRADTHDTHCRPAPGSRDYHVFAQLMEMNRAIADRIESAWEAEGLPTFKSFLRDDLSRRKAEN